MIDELEERIHAALHSHLPAEVGDSGWTPEKQRCHELLLEFVGGEHHLGKLSHLSGGLRMTTPGGLATRDGDELAQLVFLAHKHSCRVAIDSAGSGRLAIEVKALERHLNNGAE